MTAIAPRVLALGVLVLVPVGVAHAWGEKGHTMSARVAVHTLPGDVPAFFRAADVELGYLCGEPDRWRSEVREPALRGLTDRDHGLRVEDFPLPLPAHRYEFFLQYIGKPRPGLPPAVYTYRDMNFAPYAIAENAERLTSGFMLWRLAPAHTAVERRIKRQIEQNVLYSAGILAHFVTDTAQPLHTTLSTNGWSPRLPNPRGFVGENIHSRFETTYVDAAIEERDFAPLVAPVRPRGPWLEAAMEHIRAAHQHVEALYALDQTHPFGEGAEGPEAKRFTSQRLAEAAGALRDFWYTAWTRSGPLAEAERYSRSRRTSR